MQIIGNLALKEENINDFEYNQKPVFSFEVIEPDPQNRRVGKKNFGDTIPNYIK